MLYIWLTIKSPFWKYHQSTTYLGKHLNEKAKKMTCKLWRFLFYNQVFSHWNEECMLVQSGFFSNVETHREKLNNVWLSFENINVVFGRVLIGPEDVVKPSLTNSSSSLNTYALTMFLSQYVDKYQMWSNTKIIQSDWFHMIFCSKKIGGT